MRKKRFIHSVPSGEHIEFPVAGIQNRWKVAAVALTSILFAAAFSPLAADEGPNNETSAVFDEQEPQVVFLINEDPDNYGAHQTIPPFAEMLQHDYEFQTTVISAEGELPNIRFPDLEALTEADLLVVFFRRAALPQGQLRVIKNYLNERKPLVAIRTANHGFAVRESDGDILNGYEDWGDFVPDILGQENRGYGPAALGTSVAVVPEVAEHPILEGFEPEKWQSTGNVYHIELLDKDATVLLTGTAGDDVEPIAYTRKAGESKVFYTSLGYPEDFQVPQFRQLLINGIHWALEED
ncbi:MAG: ThuA domain-containing protein [Balneolales bacterium]